MTEDQIKRLNNFLEEVAANAWCDEQFDLGLRFCKIHNYESDDLSNILTTLIHINDVKLAIKNYAK